MEEKTLGGKFMVGCSTWGTNLNTVNVKVLPTLVEYSLEDKVLIVL